MKPISMLFPPAAAWIAFGGLHHASGATPLPPWYGTPGSTHQGYLFGNGSLTPTPDILDNPYGTPAATVVTGPFSDNWQDPDATYDLAGVNDDGAWDLGKTGTITIVLPFTQFAASPGVTYRVDFEVYTVAYLGISALPLFTSPGQTPGALTLSQNTVATDPLFPGATWQGLNWTGYFENLTSNTITFAIKAPANNTSVVDSIEVFTHVTIIPEPSAFLLVILPAAAWIGRRRRG